MYKLGISLTEERHLTNTEHLPTDTSVITDIDDVVCRTKSLLENPM